MVVLLVTAVTSERREDLIGRPAQLPLCCLVPDLTSKRVSAQPPQSLEEHSQPTSSASAINACTSLCEKGRLLSPVRLRRV